MNIYNIFPKDIWTLIILELPCKYIPNLYDVDNQFKDLCVKENIIEKRKLKGFPRSNGHCEVFDVSSYILNKYDIAGDFNYNDILDETLIKLYKDDVDLIRGDLVNFKTGYKTIFLFDGEQLVNTYQKLNSIFPEDFDIVNDDIPSKYWFGHGGVGWGCFNRSLFAFNTYSVKEQLIKNCKCNNQINVKHTWFTLNNKIHVILYTGQNEFTNLLKNDKIYLEVNLNVNLLHFNIKHNESINNIFHCC